MCCMGTAAQQWGAKGEGCKRCVRESYVAQGQRNGPLRRNADNGDNSLMRRRIIIHVQTRDLLLKLAYTNEAKKPQRGLSWQQKRNDICRPTRLASYRSLCAGGWDGVSRYSAGSGLVGTEPPRIPPFVLAPETVHRPGSELDGP